MPIRLLPLLPLLGAAVIAAIVWIVMGSAADAPASRTTAQQQLVAATIDRIEGDVVTIRFDGDGKADRLEEAIAASAADHSRLLLALQLGLPIEVTLDRSGATPVVTAVDPKVPEGMKTFGDLAHGDLSTAPVPKGMPRGLSPDDVPVTRVRTWDSAAMAIQHAAANGDMDDPEIQALLAERAAQDAPESRPVERAELDSVTPGTPWSEVSDRFGAPVHSRDERSGEHCRWWTDEASDRRMIGLCFDTRERYARRAPDEPNVAMQITTPPPDGKVTVTDRTVPPAPGGAR